MGVRLTLSCGGCDATVEATGPLTRTFDPYTQATYCPACWAEIEAPKAAV